MRGIYLVIFAFWCLNHCDGSEVSCTVSGDVRGVVYSVPEFEAGGCWHYWADENHTVIANHLGQNEKLVVMQTNQILILEKCKSLIYYSRNCLSEEGRFRATCHANCPNSTDVDHQVVPQTSWALISLFLSVILLLLVGVVLCFVYRAAICRGSCFYSALKRRDIPNRRQSMEEGIPF